MKQQLQQYVELVRAGPPGLFSRGDMDRLEAHVADGIAGAEHVMELSPTTIIDIGSGGGVPGIPLALACRSATVHLVESLQWKASFLAETATALNLDSRLKVHAIRVEEAVDVLHRELADVGTARAVATPPIVAEYLAPLIRVGGTLALWTTAAIAQQCLTGGDWQAELGLGNIHSLPAPSPLRREGVLLLLERVAPCPPRYPRRTGVAARRPLT